MRAAVAGPADRGHLRRPGEQRTLRVEVRLVDRAPCDQRHDRGAPALRGSSKSCS